MRRTTIALNSQIPPAPGAARVRHWLRIGGKVVAVHGDQNGVINISAAISGAGALRIRYEQHDADPWRMRSGETEVDRTARIGECLIVPRARQDIEGRPYAVLVEFQAQDPRAIVQVAA